MKYFDHAIKQLVDADEPLDREIYLKESIEYFPPKLYKYRKCNSNGFDMLKNEYIWADNPESFDDPIDSKVNHRLRYELPSIHRWLDGHLGELLYYCLPPKGMKERKGNHKLKDYIDAQEHFLDDNGKFNSKLARKEMILELKKLPKEKQDACLKVFDYFQSEAFESECKKVIQTTIDGIVNVFRNSKIIACLTARNDNSVMWENYSDKYSGFCVEYQIDTRKLTSDSKTALINMFPVIYRKRIPGINLLPFIKYHFNKSLYGREYDIKRDLVLLNKQLLYKKYDYSYEEEWRIILNEKSARQVSFPLVSAVYAGYKISDTNLKKLKIICKKKGIPLYKQNINMYTNKFSYEQIV